jgi:hypothetical protein
MTKKLETKNRVKEVLRGIPGLRGVGITWHRGQRCILVNVSADARQAVQDRLRKDLPDVDFVVQTVGEIQTE